MIKQSIRMSQEISSHGTTAQEWDWQSILGANLKIKATVYSLQSGESKELSSSDARGLICVYVSAYGIYGALGVDAASVTKLFGTYVGNNKNSDEAFTLYIENQKYYIKNNFSEAYTVVLTKIGT